ncbi:MAG: pyridoxamine 5'-phosphate oxidase family protein [Thermoleophilaceae bacterium]|nr:pyridoxamine 5'-phosphate oxidase family protein [Thermoleophilaceae bacterium]
MASKRDQIILTDNEIDAFLDEQRTVIVGTNGPRGVPHMMPLWYVVRGAEIWGWTFTKAQKIKNLERDPRATLLVETGETYDQLRGVSYECDVEMSTDHEVVRGVGVELFTRYGDGNYPVDAVIQMIEAQAPKRTALRFTPHRTMSWDHRKLGGTY